MNFFFYERRSQCSYHSGLAGSSTVPLRSVISSYVLAKYQILWFRFYISLISYYRNHISGQRPHDPACPRVDSRKRWICRLYSWDYAIRIFILYKSHSISESTHRSKRLSELVGFAHQTFWPLISYYINLATLAGWAGRVHGINYRFNQVALLVCGLCPYVLFKWRDFLIFRCSVVIFLFRKFNFILVIQYGKFLGLG